MKVRIIKASLPSYWYSDKIGEIFEVEKTALGYRITIPYNHGYIEFEDCEIIEEPTEQPKWEKLTSKGEIIEDIIYFHGWCIVKIQLLGVPILYNEEGMPNNADYVGNLIPYNQRKTELLAKKAELEKQLEEINKELEK